ncbi:hypothetical protein CCACVL1_29275 [Corchorus capsularis]|uniref:Uncharacterized protein n=1 Tax=Corchorus capsularis TaxID=210143 RepID=A0A1R3G2J5_COCAP|nr:hypothetical protein CCACVL1_29275 [Corchorus capsularis]
MATAGAGEMMLRCVLDGSLRMQETEIERRPYHRNCSCALHNLKGTICSSSSSCSRSRTISFSKKKTWNDVSLSMATSHFSSQSSLVAASEFRSLESKTSMGFCCFTDGENMS